MIADDRTPHETCHEGESWTCAGCLRPQCRRCDGVAGDEVLCWSCYQIEDSETA